MVSGDIGEPTFLHRIHFLPLCLNNLYIMSSSNGNIFRVTGPLCGEFTGPRWIPRTKVSDAELWFFSLSCAWINYWVNNREAGDLRRHRAHYDVRVMGTNLSTSDAFVAIMFKFVVRLRCHSLYVIVNAIQISIQSLKNWVKWIDVLLFINLLKYCF